MDRGAAINLNILRDYVIPIVMVVCLAGEDIEDSKK